MNPRFAFIFCLRVNWSYHSLILPDALSMAMFSLIFSMATTGFIGRKEFLSIRNQAVQLRRLPATCSSFLIAHPLVSVGIGCVICLLPKLPETFRRCRESFSLGH